jgi:integrase
LIPRNVAVEVSNLPKLTKYKSEVFDTDQIKELLSVVKNTEMHVPVTLAALCGLRRGEVLGLEWSNINFKNKTLNVCRQLIPTDDGLEFQDPKSEDSNRVINLSDNIIDILKEHKEKQDGYKRILGEAYKDIDLVNCCNDGSMIDPRNFSKQFAKVLEKNKLTHIRFHDLRHYVQR